MKKSLVSLSLVMLLVGPAMAQQASPQGSSQASPLASRQSAQGQPQQGTQFKACVSQFVEASGRSAANLIAAGYDIKAAVPGGLWMQKDREVFYCNAAGRMEDKQAVCWLLREPAPGGFC